MNLEKLKNPDKKYRPIPFWSWNEKLETEETKNQVRLLNEAGMGGFFMHARGGLQTEYMGDEWFDNVEAATSEAEKLGMYSWAYDENGWPSGFADGKVNALGEKYQQKYLCMEPGEKHTEHTICNVDGMHFYYEVNPFYVDTFDKNVIKEFIRLAYEPYYEKYKNRITGFFTDEPQGARNGHYPWSLTLPEEYKKEYGEDLLPKLREIFECVGDWKNTRMKFWRIITKMFSEAYMKQIYDWCEERGLQFTGHLVNENNFASQTPTNGACMPHYEYFHIPGMDWLGRNIADPVMILQLTSAAAQTGKKSILSETFALCGHNATFSDLRKVYEWQTSRGVNLLCTHLAGYSLRGIRKRDYPPALNYHQPWWGQYKEFIDSMSRIGMLLAEGEIECDTLLMHPQTSAWIVFDNKENREVMDYFDKFVDVINELDKKHIQYHLGDEILMERHGRVEGDTLIIGEMRYKTVILPPYIDFFDNTKRLLEEFKANGGRVITHEEAETNNVTDNPNITYLKRVFDDFDMHYFVNSTDGVQKAKINVDGVKFDIMTGDLEGFSKDYEFTGKDSLVVLEFKDGRTIPYESKRSEKINLSGDWAVERTSGNAITLDYCDCYFDGDLIEKNLPVTSICALACDLKRPVEIKCVFKVNVQTVPQNVSLVCETPEIFRYNINGRDLEFKDNGFMLDHAFRKTDIAGYLKEGENEIVLECEFAQSAKTYENIEKSAIFETEKNKLTYDMEIESIYLLGDFAVNACGEFEQLEKDAVRTSGGFVIDEMPKTVKLQNLEQQGFPFFAGDVTVSREIEVSDKNSKIRLSLKGINAVEVSVNGQFVETVVWNNTEVDLSEYVTVGVNKIELKLVNNLRNILGPHHLEEGESYTVGPFSFFREKNIWQWHPEPEKWNDGYCFVETSVLE